MEIIRELAKVLGVDPSLIEGSLGTTFGGALVLFARAWYLAKKMDTKKIDFEQKLVDMTANATEENRKLRDAYEKNTEAIQITGEVLKELVLLAKELKTEVPIKLAEHDTAMAKMFLDKADEMHKVTERHDTEHEGDRQKREADHKELMEQLSILKKEVTDATDETTLRSAVNKILTALDAKPKEE